MTHTEAIDAERLIDVIAGRGAGRRCITAIAGAPGSGKSTLAASLVERLNVTEAGCAAVLPMDGFHYDNMILDPRGWLGRKGAPHTFDVAGLSHMLARLRRNEEDVIAVPVFDRDLEIARNGARLINRSVRHVIVEGNYLLLRQEPWHQLVQHFDITVFLDVPMDILLARLEDRWKDLPESMRSAKLRDNDMPNATLVQSECRPAEYVIRYLPDQSGPAR